MQSRKHLASVEREVDHNVSDQRDMANLGHLMSVLRGLERGGLLTDKPVDEVEKWLHKRVTFYCAARGEGLCD